jgi:hypothetical protein
MNKQQKQLQKLVMKTVWTPLKKPAGALEPSYTTTIFYLLNAIILTFIIIAFFVPDYLIFYQLDQLNNIITPNLAITNNIILVAFVLFMMQMTAHVAMVKGIYLLLFAAVVPGGIFIYFLFYEREYTGLNIFRTIVIAVMVTIYFVGKMLKPRLQDVGQPALPAHNPK